MSTLNEKFAIQLGFDEQQLKKLKELVALQNAEEKKGRKTQQESLALDRKRLQLRKAIARAESSGVDATRYKKSLSAAKNINLLEKRRLELEGEILSFKKRQTTQDLKQAKLASDKLEKEKAASKMRSIEAAAYRENAARNAQVKREAYERNLRAEKDWGSADMRTVRKFDPKQAELLKEQIRLTRKGSIEYTMLKNRLKDVAKAMRETERSSNRLARSQNSLATSSRHLLRSLISVYAAIESVTYINRTGQAFEAMESAMLSATGTAELAASEIDFLDKMTDRLGMSLLDTSDSYSKFLFASKGKLSTEETRELFEGMSELGTALGISKERMKLSMRAIQQMMNKGKISSEELRLQLAESLPGSIQIFARSLGVGEQELLKMMESGTLLAEDVLPKVAKEMKKVASVGLAEKLETTRVAQGQLNKEMEQSADTIFEGGFGEGAKDLFQSIALEMREGETGLKSFGQVFKLVLEGLATVVRFVGPILDSLLFVVGKIAEGLNFAFGEKSLAMVTLFGAALLKALRPIHWTILGIVGLLDEVFSLFTKGRMGVIEAAIGEDIDLRDYAMPDLMNANEEKLNNFRVKAPTANWFDGSKNQVGSQKYHNNNSNNVEININGGDLSQVRKVTEEVINDHTRRANMGAVS